MTPAHSFLLAFLCDPLPVEHLRALAKQVLNWETLLPLAIRHDVVCLLHRALDAIGEEVPAEVRKQVRIRFAAEALRALYLDRERQRLTGLLLAAGIPVIPWKGPALAEELYGDVTSRNSVDLDLLVPPDLAWQALQLLQADGYLPGFEVTGRNWPALRRLGNHLALEHEKCCVTVELHWELLPPIHAFFFDLSGHWKGLAAGGTPREGRLSPEETLVLLCAHGAVHCWEKLKWVVDLDRLVRRRPELNWDGALAIAKQMGSRRSLLLGLLLARDACGTPLPEAVALLQARDLPAARLAGELRTGWFADPNRQVVFHEHFFHLHCRERLRDRLTWILRQLFAPRLADWLLFPLGSLCYPLFYLERPMRMGWKWLVMPLVSSGARQER